MRRKHFTQLLSAQQKLERSRHVASARVKQAAHDGDTPALHEAIARGWKLEQQAQTIRQELYNRRRERPGVFGNEPKPTVFDDCQVTLRHDDSVRTVRFSSMLATDVETGLVGLDTSLGRALRNASLMSIVSVPTALGEKTYQVVAISKLRTRRQTSPRRTNATTRSADIHKTEV